MRVFFDSTLKIFGVFEDSEEVNFPGAFEIHVPVEFKTKLEKTFSFVRHKKDVSGNLLFKKADGNETLDHISDGKSNAPVMEELTSSRKVGLKEAANDWTLDEVLTEKYKAIANGRQFRFEEFLNDSAINKDASIVNTGLNSVSVPPKGVLTLKSIQLSKPIKRFSLYVEGADGLDVGYSVDGQNFVALKLNTDTNISKTDTLTFNFCNNNEDGPAIPVRAIAIFF